MKKKNINIVLIFLISILFLQGCGSAKEEAAVAGKMYTYTGESFSGIENDYFKIAINEDGTYNYYESFVSSYIGIGKWSVKDGILTLTEDEVMGFPLVNHFLIEGDDIVYIEEDSSNFLYIKVKDGERFTGVPLSSDSREAEE